MSDAGGMSIQARAAYSAMTPIALDARGRIVTAVQVPRGAACNCHCPVCSEPLVAKQGDIIGWHFAHRSKHSNCGESAVHHAAKTTLAKAEGRFIALPATGRPGDQSYRYRIIGAEPEFRLDLPRMRRVDLMLTLDVTCRSRPKPPRDGPPCGLQKRLAVEIAVTNFKDAEYVAGLPDSQIPTIEIDLSPPRVIGLMASAYWIRYGAEAALRNVLLSSKKGKYWLWPPPTYPQCEVCRGRCREGERWCFAHQHRTCIRCGNRCRRPYRVCLNCKVPRDDWDG